MLLQLLLQILQLKLSKKDTGILICNNLKEDVKLSIFHNTDNNAFSCYSVRIIDPRPRY